MRYGEPGTNTLVDQFYVRPPEEMYRLFPGREEAVKRSQEIADGVRHRPRLQDAPLPRLHAAGGQDAGGLPARTVRRRACATATARSRRRPCSTGWSTSWTSSAGWASPATSSSSATSCASPRSKSIPAGARGSACGAMVSYVLKLSHVDPLEYDLLFERFLDPNRSEAPDIDIDFCQERREEVIAYVRKKYGEGSVAQIATFGTLAAHAAIKDVGRVLDFPLERVDAADQHDPQDAGDHAGRGPEREFGTPQSLRVRPGGARADRHRPQAGGDQPQRRHARGRRGDRQRAADRLRAAAARGPQGRRRRLAGRRGRRDDAVGAWATWKRSACSRWISWACAP